MVVIGDGIRVSDFRATGNVACCAYDLHIANETATCVAIAAVIDVGGADEKSACVVAFFLLFLLRGVPVGLTGRSGAPEDIKGHDAIYKKTRAIVRILSNTV